MYYYVDKRVLEKENGKTNLKKFAVWPAFVTRDPTNCLQICSCVYGGARELPKRGTSAPRRRAAQAEGGSGREAGNEDSAARWQLEEKPLIQAQKKSLIKSDLVLSCGAGGWGQNLSAAGFF